MRFSSLMFLTFILYQQEYKCLKFFDVISKKWDKFTNGVSLSFNRFANNVRNVFHPTAKHPVEINQLTMEDKIHGGFLEFIERTVANADLDYSEYMDIRSEPTALMSTVQLAALHGRSIQSHVIKTKDNYFITLHRILIPKNCTNHSYDVVLLHHGLLGSSADWILLGPNKSLPYYLSDLCYDVWMTNARGNYYSRRHVNWHVNSSTYWKFSFQEMGTYDLPATIAYIHKIKNNTKQISFIGHSIGATAYLVMLSSLPKYNKHFRLAILLAPLVFISNTNVGPMNILRTLSLSPPEQFLRIIGENEFIPSRKVPEVLSSKFCIGPNKFCSNPLFFLVGGFNEGSYSDSGYLSRVLYHIPAGGSTNTILHLGQLMKLGKFVKFGSSSEFKLKNVVVPVILISSSEDWVASVPDVFQLYFCLGNAVDHYVIRGENVSHSDFVYGANADEVVFSKIINFLKINMFPSQKNCSNDIFD